MRRKLLAALAACGLVMSIAGSATAVNSSRKVKNHMDRFVNDVLRASLDDNHGTGEGHLPGSSKNMKLISKLRLTDTEGGVSDVSYHKGFAYIGKYSPACVSNGGIGSGVAVVDVRDAKNPKEVGFIQAGPDAYVSEGVHVLSVNTPFFKGDLLLHSNESCSLDEAGGISIYDVSDPSNPVRMVDQFGDTDANDPEDPTPLPLPNSVHSVMGWADGNHAYAVAVDNFEGLDVDIFDISDPANPVLVSETGLEEWPEISPQLVHGESAFIHDMWVKKIDGQWMMLVSYWDAGWVLLNVDDPANPVFVTDSDYAATDPEMPAFSPPEGNAHQAAWTSNNKFIIGTDEDFSPNRTQFFINSGDNAGEYAAGEFGWTPQIVDTFPGAQVTGSAVYGGSGCPDDPTTTDVNEGDTDGNGIADRDEVPDAADFPAAEGEQSILILTRGTCFFSEKVESGELKGWDVVIVGNTHAGSGNGATPDAIICGSKGHDYEPTVVGGCIGHRAMHLLFGSEPAYEGGDYNGSDIAPIGTVGDEVTLTATFDGWGYVHLLDGQTLESIDTYAVPEAIDPAYADVFPLSVHEVKTDPRKGVNLGYVSWYTAGARVLKASAKGLKEVGHYIGPNGSDFWGVFPIRNGSKRPLVLYSDRDYGLYILKYTGPE